MTGSTSSGTFLSAFGQVKDCIDVLLQYSKSLNVRTDNEGLKQTKIDFHMQEITDDPPKREST